MLLARRVGAYVTDIVLLFLVLAPLGQLVRFGIGLPTPTTGRGIWFTLTLNFSLPVWAYFILSDSSAGGATAGKRLFRVHVTRLNGGRVGVGRATLRTAVKLLPWELTHLSAFGLSEDLARFELPQVVGLAIANGLALLYLGMAAWTHGLRSVHDYVVATEVSRLPD